MSPATSCRVAGAFIGGVLLLVLPGALVGPAIFGKASFQALPAWALPAACASAAFGVWHLVTAAFALEEDLEFITGYYQAQDAVPLVVPFVLYVGTRSVYRRLFAPTLVARRRWELRRTQRLQREATMVATSSVKNTHSTTVPRES